MSLILQIIRCDKNQPPIEKSLTLDEMGGSIGRSTANDWVLPDAQRYLSGRHAVIKFQQGDYYITDTSTNGVFINNKATPLGKDNTALLKQGDILKMGSYEVEVTIPDRRPPPSSGPETVAGGFDGRTGLHSPQARKPAPARPQPPVDPFVDFSPPPERRSETPKPASHSEGLPDFDFGDFSSTPSHSPTDDPFFKDESFLPAAGRSSEGDKPAAKEKPDKDDPFLGLSGYFSPSGISPPAKQAVDSPAKAEPSISDEFDFSGLGMDSPVGLDAVEQEPEPEPALPYEADKPVRPIRQPPPAFNEPPADTANQVLQKLAVQATPSEPAKPTNAGIGGMEGFLLGMGITDPDVQKQVAQHLSPEMAGMLFRMLLQGTIDVMRTRAEIKSEMRMDVTTIQPIQNNPVKFSVNVDDALLRLFIPRNNSYMPPGQALQESFEDIKAHQVAVISGVQAALKHVLQRFAPESLVSRLQKQSPISASIPIHRQAKLWLLFEDLYSTIEGEASDDFQRLFGLEFARAYEEQVLKLKSASPGKLP